MIPAYNDMANITGVKSFIFIKKKGLLRLSPECRMKAGKRIHGPDSWPEVTTEVRVRQLPPPEVNSAFRQIRFGILF
jgi:hypothetical protein